MSCNRGEVGVPLLHTSFLLLLLFCLSCVKKQTSSHTDDSKTVGETAINKKGRKARFIGNYNKEFNDLHALHIVAAIQNGIEPMETRADTTKHKKNLMRLPDELELYKTDQLTHSTPFLVPSATRLLMDICVNFRDSLYRKELPIYKLYLTSVTRTKEDVQKLAKRNYNATENSAHFYGTTFDISWKRFDKLDCDTNQTIPSERLKLVLAQVLFDLKHQERCYVKHERKQACFHITVR